MKFLKVILIPTLLIAFTYFIGFTNITNSEDEVEAKFKPLYELDSIYLQDNSKVEEYGNIFEDDRLNIAIIANNEVGTYGGYKYTSYFGLRSGMAWCCVFVSWCGDQLGLIDEGAMPRFYSVSSGYEQFKDLGLWLSGSETPDIGMVVFFDLATTVVNENGEIEFVDGHDYRCDHVGIVVNVDNYYVYTIEGNYNNAVCKAKYPIGSIDIIGYGTPLYN